MNVQQVLKAKAREQGVSLEIVHKDYAISYLLTRKDRVRARRQKA